MGVAERRQREKEARVKSIKSSAKILFNRQGSSNFSMAEIAEYAEVSKGALCLHFKSKEELYYSLIGPIQDQHHSLIAGTISNGGEPADETLRRFASYQLGGRSPFDSYVLCLMRISGGTGLASFAGA